MDNRLLDILVCPICKGALNYNKAAQELVCPRDRLAYPIRDDIPVMLESQARRLDAPVLPAPGTAASETGEHPVSDADDTPGS